MDFFELRHVSYAYPGQSLSVLTEINLNLEQAGITALVGPNGCGKTTLTKLMIGVLKPTTGQINLAGRSLHEYTLAEIGKLVGYVFQNPSLQLFCANVAEEIGFGPTHRGCEAAIVRERVKFYLDYFELTPYRNAFPLHLSQGEKQRLALAAVLANEPEFLILDEPTIGLDAYRKKQLENFLRKIIRLNRGIMLISHDMPFVHRLSAKVITIHEGQLLQ